MTSEKGIEKASEKSWDIGDSKFEVDGTIFAETLLGIGTVSASGDNCELIESGNTKVASAKCCDP